MMQPSIKPADEHSAGDIIARIGSLTRMLRDSLRELGLDCMVLCHLTGSY